MVLSQIDIHQAGLPNRAINALDNAKQYQTVGELVKAKDQDLMQVKNLGRKTIEQVRARIAELRMEQADKFVPKDELEWARTHSNLIRAIMAGEVVMRIR